MGRRSTTSPPAVDHGRLRRVVTVDTRVEARDAADAARLSGDRVRIPVSGDFAHSSPGAFRTARLPTADEQARGEWPERDELDEAW